MKREVKALYNQSFQLAFEVAKKAERALQTELGDPSQSYIQFSYLDGIEGLLAGSWAAVLGVAGLSSIRIHNFSFRIRFIRRNESRCCSSVSGLSLASTSNDRLPFS